MIKNRLRSLNIRRLKGRVKLPLFRLTMLLWAVLIYILIGASFPWYGWVIVVVLIFEYVFAHFVLRTMGHMIKGVSAMLSQTQKGV